MTMPCRWRCLPILLPFLKFFKTVIRVGGGGVGAHSTTPHLHPAQPRPGHTSPAQPSPEMVPLLPPLPLSLLSLSFNSASPAELPQQAIPCCEQLAMMSSEPLQLSWQSTRSGSGRSWVPTGGCVCCCLRHRRGLISSADRAICEDRR